VVRAVPFLRKYEVPVARLLHATQCEIQLYGT
jgi:hypothetical protein